MGMGTIQAETLTLDLEKSRMHWIGTKFNGAHDGDIKIKSGQVTFEKDMLNAGQFTIDMTSIRVLDIKDAGSNAKLERH